MKKLFLLCLIFLISIMPITNVNAATLREKEFIDKGPYATDLETRERVEPIEVNESVTMSTRGDTIHVTQTIVYNGEVTPSATIGSSKIIGTAVYKGTLYLHYYYYMVADNQTTAYYEGTLYLQPNPAY